MSGTTFLCGLQAIDSLCILMEKASIGPTEIRALVALARATDGEASCPVSRQALADGLGVTVDRYKVLQARLVAAGLVLSCQARRSAASPSVAMRGLTAKGWEMIEALSGLIGDRTSADAPAWPLATPHEVDDIAFDAAALGLAPAHAEMAAPPRVDAGIEALGVLAGDAAIVLELVEEALAPLAAGRDQQDMVELCLQALWSCLLGSTAYRGWSVGARVKGVASLVRSGRWGRPRAMPPGWEAVAALHVRSTGGANTAH